MSLSIYEDIQVSLEFPFCLLNINLFVKSISHFFLTQLTNGPLEKATSWNLNPLGLEEEFPKLADVPSRERPHIPYQSALLSRWFSSFQGVPVFFGWGSTMFKKTFSQVLIFFLWKHVFSHFQLVSRWVTLPETNTWTIRKRGYKRLPRPGLGKKEGLPKFYNWGHSHLPGLGHPKKERDRLPTINGQGVIWLISLKKKCRSTTIRGPWRNPEDNGASC